MWVVTDAQIEHRQMPTFNLGSQKARVGLSEASVSSTNGRIVQSLEHSFVQPCDMLRRQVFNSQHLHYF